MFACRRRAAVPRSAPLYIVRNWTQGGGELEAYACTACGLMEWYVRNPAELQERDGLRIIDGGAEESGPYR